MGAMTAATSIDADIDERVFAHTIERTRHGTTNGIYGGIALALAFAVVFRDQSDGFAYRSWLAAAAAVFAFRFWQVMPALPASGPALRAWSRRLVAGYVVAGILWGSASFAFFPGGEHPSSYFLAASQSVLIMASVAALSWHPPAFAAFAIPVFLMMGTPWIVQGSPYGWPVQILGLIILAILIDYVRKNAVLLAGSVRMRFERESLMAQLEARTAQAERVNQSKTRFLAGASHDLRQPLHALGLIVAHAVATRDPLEVRASLAQIQAMTRALGELIDSLLDISKLDADAVKPSVQAVPLQAILDRVVEEGLQVAECKGLQVRVRRTGAWVRTDPVLLTRMLRNLLANAINHTKRGGILVAARHRGGDVRVEVWDTGIGIAPDQQQRIFEEFVQINNPTRDRGKGVGLGLAIVARLALLLSHDVNVRSRPGRGSCFSLSLPHTAPDPVGFAGAQAAWNGHSLEGGRIMVIDDDAAVLSSTEALLRDWGCEVTAVPGLAAAIEELERTPQPPQVLVCDHRLGKVTGLQAIGVIRALVGLPLPALIVTGDVPSLVDTSTLAPPFHLLTKPVAPVTLRAALAQMLRQAESVPAPAPQRSPESAN